MEKQTETIYEILQTPVENLRADQVDFMEEVLRIYQEKNRKPWCVLGSLTGLVASFGLSLSMFLKPISVSSFLLIYVGIAATAIFTKFLAKSFGLADYKKLNTNKFSFEEFEFSKGIEQVEKKLDAYYEYEANEILKSMQETYNAENEYNYIKKPSTNVQSTKTTDVSKENDIEKDTDLQQ